ncbi:DHH family phosphoesterase [Candidatus Pacearchaeota archaeon]|nr:DHH family phosphoesterase [Candidatus Pacearchaeota archaeon]
MLASISKVAKQFLEKTENKKIQVISHNDTDGITSASIITRALQRMNKEFSLRIVKQLDSEVFKEIPEDKVVLFLDLASNSFQYIKDLKNPVFILDHHEIISKIPENVIIINPHLFHEEEISGAGLAYLFAKELSDENIDLAYLAAIGMVGDMLEKNLGKIYTNILKDSKVIIKKGLTLYPATRPIDKVLEYSSDIYIPNVSGSASGVNAFLRDIGIQRVNNKYKNLIELNPEELSKLITAISLQSTNIKDSSEIIGNIYLVNFFNKVEDIRQISAMINACSRLGESRTAIAFCLQNKKAKAKAENIYAQYRQSIVNALGSLPNLRKIEQKNYIIIHAENKIKDTIIGTIASILSNSRTYEEGKAIIAMAYNENKIKVSARVVGKNGKNIREILNSVIEEVGGEVGGHKFAAGCLVEKENEQKFLDMLQKKLEIEMVKI